MKSLAFISIPLLIGMVLSGCSKSDQKENLTAFTKADSLTDKYLELEDNMLVAWNQVVSNDNAKVRMMHTIVHELLLSNQYNKEVLIAIESRLKELSDFKFTQETIKDPTSIEEYDFATNTLFSELVIMAQSNETFAHNPSLQKMVEELKQLDQQVETNRSNYDIIALEFNRFIEKNKSMLTDINAEKKALFQMTATD